MTSGGHEAGREPGTRRRTARAVVATIGSLILPGAGHLAIGSPRAGLLYLLPSALALVAGVAYVAANDAYGIGALLVTPGALTIAFAANLMLAGWRLSATVEAVGRTTPTRLGTVASAALVLALLVVPHAFVGNAILAAQDFLDSTFAQAEPEPTSSPEPTPSPAVTQAAAVGSPGPSPSGSPGATPSPTPEIAEFPTNGGNGTLPAFGAKVPWTRPGEFPWGDDGRFDLLLLGSDAGSDRWSRRTDVMLLVEVDVETGAIAMIGLPRNLQNAPYPAGPARDAVACGCQTGLLNEMYVEATARHPGRWPGTGAVKGIGAVRAVVSEITGRPIDAVLIADLTAVIRVVDAMGGVDIDVPEAVYDSHYPDPVKGSIQLSIKAGPQHFDGRTALAYARTRHQDSDYGRMERQQILLLAIREQLGPAVIFSAPALFGAAKGQAWTDLPRESLPALVELFGTAAEAKVKQLRVIPSRYSAWLTAAEVTRIRKDVAALLPGTPAPSNSMWPKPVSQPRPTPKPTPRPTAAPSPTTDPGVAPSPAVTPAPDPTPADTLAPP